jgi:hypothetical protein
MSLGTVVSIKIKENCCLPLETTVRDANVHSLVSESQVGRNGSHDPLSQGRD